MSEPRSAPEPEIPERLGEKGLESLRESAHKAYRAGYREGWKAGWRAGLLQYVRPGKPGPDTEPPGLGEEGAPVETEGTTGAGADPAGRDPKSSHRGGREPS